MRRRTRWLWTVLTAAAALGAAGAFGPALARGHVARAIEREDVGEFRCGDCHDHGAQPSYESGPAHADPSSIAVVPDGSAVYVTAAPLRTIARVELADGRVTLGSELPGRPADLALSPDGARLAVSLRDTDEVAWLDPVSLSPLRSSAVGTAPAGLAFAGTGERLIVANSASGDLSIVDSESGRETLRLAGGREPYAVAATADGNLVAVVSRMVEVGAADEVPSSEVTLVDGRSGRVSRRVLLPSIHLAEAAAFTADGRFLLVPSIRVRNLMPILQVARGWVMSGVVCVVDVEQGRVVSLPLGDPMRQFSDPTGIAIDDQRRLAYVASGGSDSIAELDLDALLAAARRVDPAEPERLSTSRRYVRRRFAVGRNPRGLATAGGTLVVAERLDDRLGVFVDGRSVSRIPIGPPVALDPIRRGDRVFHDARYAFQEAFSCRSCHPGGHTDGLTYDFDIDGVGRNVLLNRSLLGVGDTAPFKWVGLNPTLHRQCGPRFAMVLTRADPFPEDKLDDLVAYLESLPPPRPESASGIVAGRESGAVERGRRLFERETRKDGTAIPPLGRCSRCHSGAHFTNRQKANVGTQGPRDRTGDFDVPHLTGIASKAPYLHDGRALSLEEIWTLPGVGDRHGVVTDLNKADLNDLVAYLRTL